jgi:hypothetical protein
VRGAQIDDLAAGDFFSVTSAAESIARRTSVPPVPT